MSRVEIRKTCIYAFKTVANIEGYCLNMIIHESSEIMGVITVYIFVCQSLNRGIIIIIIIMYEA